MGKYSSESENEKRGSKHSSNRSRRRSSSPDSTDSKKRRRRENKKSSRRSRSKSRDRYSRPRRSRSASNLSAHRSSKSKSHGTDSRDKSRQKDRRRRSTSRSRDKRRDRRSRSKDYIREYVSKPRKRHNSGSSSSDSEKSKKVSHTKATAAKIQKAAVPPPQPENSAKNGTASPDCVIIDSKVLDEINEDKFTPKEFTSGKSKKVPENIVIDLTKNTIKVPEVEPVEPDSIFHHSLFINEEARMEKWVKELYSFRQKALQQGLKSNQ